MGWWLVGGPVWDEGVASGVGVPVRSMVCRVSGADSGEPVTMGKPVAGVMFAAVGVFWVGIVVSVVVSAFFAQVYSVCVGWASFWGFFAGVVAVWGVVAICCVAAGGVAS